MRRLAVSTATPMGSPRPVTRSKTGSANAACGPGRKAAPASANIAIVARVRVLLIGVPPFSCSEWKPLDHQSSRHTPCAVTQPIRPTSYWRTAHGVCLLLVDGTRSVPRTGGRHTECTSYWWTAHGVCLLLVDGTRSVPPTGGRHTECACHLFPPGRRPFHVNRPSTELQAAASPRLTAGSWEANLRSASEKGTRSICRNGPKRASHRIDRVPFSLRNECARNVPW